MFYFVIAIKLIIKKRIKNKKTVEEPDDWCIEADQVNRVQMERAPITASQIREATCMWGSSSLSCDVLHSAWLASGKMHSRRAEDLLQ